MNRQHLLIWPRVGDSAFDLNRFIAGTHGCDRTTHHPHLVEPALLGNVIYSGSGLPESVLRGFETTTNDAIRAATSLALDRSDAFALLAHAYNFGAGSLSESERLFARVRTHVETLFHLEALRRADLVTAHEAAHLGSRATSAIHKGVEEVLGVARKAPVPGVLLVSNEGRLVLKLSPLFETAATLLGKYQALMTSKILPAMMKTARLEQTWGPVISLATAFAEISKVKSPKEANKIIGSLAGGVVGEAAGARLWVRVGAPLLTRGMTTPPIALLIVGAGATRVFAASIGAHLGTDPFSEAVTLWVKSLEGHDQSRNPAGPKYFP